ncbi:BQ5605_C036g11492 [Microbotryum silenes-dioicae]|uniref:BQ5605_C036g11492 protein n=1 Tax=Microbotryum silenes-dioicae TaxID=796604 RepID=A0A2X0MJF9_9BASI|nr:BQ5605_C036g11492 [Microbotryum silenes-dioicae]
MSISPSSRVLVVPPDAESLRLIGQHLGARLDKRRSLLPTWRMMIRCSLRQLVLSNVKLRLEQLQIVCQTHNLQGYSLRRSRAKKLFLRILLSSCAGHCSACESGYIFKRSTAKDILVPRPTTFDFEECQMACSNTDSRVLSTSLPPERQRSEHLLVTSESEAKLRLRACPSCDPSFSEHGATAWKLGNSSSIAFNTPNLLTAKPQVVSIQHQLMTPMIHWKDGVTGGAGGRRGSACSHLDPENILDLLNYSRFYAEVRERLFTGRKYAKGYPTQLPVTVDPSLGDLHKDGYPTLGSARAPWVKVIYVRLSAPSRLALGGTDDTPDHAPADSPTQS